MPRISTIQRSMQYIRQHLGGGYIHRAERWNSHARKRQDMFGFCDVLWVSHDGIHHYIQCCNFNDLSQHIHKVQASEAANALKDHFYVSVELHAWRKVVKRGKPTWELKVLKPFKV